MTGRLVTQDEAVLREIAALAVERGTALGADGVTATARANAAIQIAVRDGTVETALRDGNQSLSVTLFRDGRSGSASTVALDEASVARAVAEALSIAGRVQPDPEAGLADHATLAFEGESPALYEPSALSPADLIDRAMALEAAAMAQPALQGVALKVAEASVMRAEALTALATSAGFCRSYASSSHAQWATMLADDGSGSVRDGAQDMDRRFDRLPALDHTAKDAAKQVLSQVGGRSLSSRRVPVIFDAAIAPAFVHDLVQALSGRPQFSRSTFLPAAIDTRIAATHVDLAEDPWEPFGLASGGFDPEGVAGQARDVIAGGVCTGYFLGTPSARRLGMRSTGNAGGPWNLRLTSRAGAPDREGLIRQMDRGLIVTQLMGGGTDPVSGTWTQAVSGLWVEGGEIVHAVGGVTLGGDMRSMLEGIVAVGGDVKRSGGVRTGSILIDAMQIGGAA